MILKAYKEKYKTEHFGVFCIIITRCSVIKIKIINITEMILIDRNIQNREHKDWEILCRAKYKHRKEMETT